MAKKSFGAATALAVGLVCLGSGPVFAAQDTTAAAMPAKAKKDTSRRLCRNLVLSGTRLSTRFCRTDEDWDRDERKAQRDHLDSRLHHSSRDGGHTPKQP